MTFTDILSILSSLATILTFLYEVWMIKKDTNNVATINLESTNSIYTKITNYNVNMNNEYNSSSKSNKDSSDVPIIILIALFSVYFYIKYEFLIENILILTCIGGLILQCISLLILYKQNLISPKFVYYNTLKWLPIIFLINLINNPIFYPTNIKNVKQAYLSQGIFPACTSYTWESIYLLTQLVGVVFIMMIIIFNIYNLVKISIRLLFKKNFNYSYLTEIKSFIFGFVFSFILVSGILYKLLILFKH